MSESKNIFLAGVGAAALTYERATELVTSLVEKGKLSIEEGKELSEELKRDAKEKAQNATDKVFDKVSNARPITREELRVILEEYNFATKADILEIKRILEKIEEKLT